MLWSIPVRASSLGVCLLLSACAGGGGGGGGTSPASPSTPPSAPDVPSEVGTGAAAFAGVDMLSPLDGGFEVSWAPLRDAQGDGAAFFYEVFLASGGADPDFQSPLRQTAPGAARVRLTGFADGTRVRVAVRAVSVSTPAEVDANEIFLEAEVRPLLYVDGAVAASGGGRQPGAPLRTLAEAVAAAGSQGANILVAEGTYFESLSLGGGIGLFGGYPRGFQGPRQVDPSPTILVPPAGGVGIDAAASTRLTVVDGIDCRGTRGALSGVLLRDADFVLSNSTIQQMTREGVVLISTQRSSRVTFHRTRILQNRTEGVEGRGAFDFAAQRCAIAGNGHEGVEFDDLTVFPDARSTFFMRSCVLADNGEEGLDIDYNERNPLDGNSSENGVIEVVLGNSHFLQNGTAGVLLDIDFDELDEVEARAFLEGCVSRGNRQQGFLLDADEASLFVLSGNRTSANRAQGLLITSEFRPGTILVSNHWDLGSGREGIQVVGPADVHLSHVAVSGSGAAAIQGNGTTRLVNGTLFLGSQTQACDVEYSFVEQAHPGAGNVTGPVQFTRFPLQILALELAGTPEALTLPAGINLQPGDILEFDDEGLPRRVVSRVGRTIRFTPALPSALAAGSIVALHAGIDVEENPTLTLGSSWTDAGDPAERDEDGSITDIGVLGGRLQAFEASRTGDRMPFVAERLEPPGGVAAVPVPSVRVRFSRDLDPASVTAASFQVSQNGSPVAGLRAVTGTTVQFTPTQPFAPGAVEVVLEAGLRDARASPLALPLRHRFEVP